ncbi:MAG: hypothetical protein LUE98_09690 [Tannerellaceae bacterium]|nr:hypothetical protein [Tannerellaceae bacterium]
MDRCSPESALQDEFPENSLHTLTCNYRNSRKIIKFAKAVFNEAVIPKEIVDSCKDLENYPRLIVTWNDQVKVKTQLSN